MTVISRLNKTARIERSTMNRSATGEVSRSWSVVAEAVPSALTALGGQSRLAGSGFATEADYLALMPSGTDVRPSAQGGAPDRVTVNSITYTVVHVVESPQVARYLAVYLKRLA